MHVRAPKDCSSIGMGGVEIKINESRVIEVPDHVAEQLVKYHGFEKTRPPEIRTDQNRK